ncbi:MAG: hypothetical protein RSF67_04835 [Clostridia bacterium]
MMLKKDNKRIEITKEKNIVWISLENEEKKELIDVNKNINKDSLFEIYKDLNFDFTSFNDIKYLDLEDNSLEETLNQLFDKLLIDLNK